jgi:serine/threonine-protein kinase RsbW
MGSPAADVSLVVPAVADSIAIIRQTVSGICEAVGADARVVGDVKLAATEACTNVVLHAYAGRDDGLVELDASATSDELRLIVRDRGHGMTPAPLAEGLVWGCP